MRIAFGRTAVRVGVHLYRFLQKAFFLHILGASLTVLGDGNLQVHFTKGIQPQHQNQILRDFDLLWRLRFADPSGEFKRILKIPSLHPEHLQTWLGKRVHYIMHAEHKLDNSVIKTIESPKYSVGMVMRPTAQRKTLAAKGPGTMMTNVGTVLYKSAKDSGDLYSIELAGIGAVLIDSPRVGIFKIGNIFFDRIFDDGKMKSAQADFIHSVFRLATFFHEARHTDGRGSSLGFLHSICPASHSYAGLPACDVPGNGPYRIGGLFINSVINDCSQCSEGQKDALRILRNDNLSRVLSLTADVDAGADEDLCEFNIFSAAACERDKKGVVEWQDEPEYIQ
jgi:hypothetical protein